MKTPLVIIGAGPTGLGAAVRLHEMGFEDFVVLEAGDRPGGLASSFRDDRGFTWDLGGHVQFSHYERFDQAMDRALGSEGWLHHGRESWIWLHGRFVRYPFQNNLHQLEGAERWSCARGLLEAWLAAREGRTSQPVNFRDWITATFGCGIAETFMLPYNFKVWAYPPEELGHYWIGERVAVPDFPTLLESLCLGPSDDTWGPNHHFRFPRSGGTGAIWRSVASWLPPDRLRLGVRVVRIDADRRRVFCEDGAEIAYEQLISTMPVGALARCMEDHRAAAMASRLRFSSTHVIGVGLEGAPPEAIRTKSWMYFPGSDSPYYRVTVFSNYSPHNTPDPARYWSLMAEVSESPVKAVPRDVVERTMEAMKRDQLISDRDRVVSTWHRRLEYGYPTPSLDRDDVLRELLPYLERQGIYSRGRFGAWKYEVSNQDHSYAQGYELIDRLKGAGGATEDEPTLRSPGLVNGRRNP